MEGLLYCKVECCGLIEGAYTSNENPRHKITMNLFATWRSPYTAEIWLFRARKGYPSFKVHMRKG